MKVTVDRSKYGIINSFTLDTEDESRVNDGIVYDTLEDAMYNNGHGYGCDLIVLTAEQLDKIKSGGVLAWDDGEYVHYVAVKEMTLKEKIKGALSQKTEDRKKHEQHQPRYDDVFFEGIKALDEIDHEDVEEE